MSGEADKAPPAEDAPSGNIMTRSKPFQKLVEWAFSVCDTDKTGQVGKAELYAGLLLVHVNLAKYAGPAACFPPPREAVNALFDASDNDNSGTIDKKEFIKIMAVCCAQIMGRILVYYAILILMVPYLAQSFVDYMEFDEDSYEEMAAQQVISMSIFFLIIPVLWNYIDDQLHNVASHHKEKTLSGLDDNNNETKED